MAAGKTARAWAVPVMTAVTATGASAMAPEAPPSRFRKTLRDFFACSFAVISTPCLTHLHLRTASMLGTFQEADKYSSRTRTVSSGATRHALAFASLLDASHIVLRYKYVR